MLPPLHHIIIPAVIAFFSASVAALLAIFLTPLFQHYFWKRQKREEIRLAIVTEVNKLAADFSLSYLLRDSPEIVPPLSVTFYQSWEVLDGQVKALFSDSTYNEYKRLYEFTLLVGFYSTQEFSDRTTRVNKFKERRNGVLLALYKEIGVL
jgi:hypothetical protein